MFHHEARIKLIQAQKERLDQFDAVQFEYNHCYEIFEEWQLREEGFGDGGYLSNPAGVTLYRGNLDSPYEIERFLQQIESEILLDQYHVEIDAGSAQFIYYNYTHKKTENKFSIQFYNAYCKQVTTGKLIPETITICNHAEE